jgi:molybdopterin-guanine dinucleotide biosynthesis protein A
MGCDKALLPLGGKPLWQISADILAPFTETILFVGQIPGFSPPPSYSLFPDMPPGQGPLGGIATGLEASGYERNLIMAVDYPFVRPALLKLLLARSEGVQAVCGRSQSCVEPLIAYYHSDCAPVIRSMLAEGESRTHNLYDRVPSAILDDAEVNAADPKRISYIDLDSPDDLARALILNFGK